MRLPDIWERIVRETSQSQIQDGENRGLVKNFLVDDIYLRESAFAAKIFATEYKRTKNEEYLQKAILSLDALRTVLNSRNIAEGIDEPVWTPRGVVYRKGSIPATILLLYAIEETVASIGYEFDYDIRGILNYLEQCYLGNGRFYHDKVDRKNKSHRHHVVNTTAMSYFFLLLAESKGICSDFLKRERKKIENAIIRSQRSDGFFSYIEPNIFQKFFYKIHCLLPNVALRVYNKLLGDESILFGDALHHVAVPYYYLAIKNKLTVELTESEKSFLGKSWAFIESNLKESDNFNGIYFDFSWEPKPGRLRYCNFMDTSTYFYILHLLMFFKKFEIVSNADYTRYANGLVEYVGTHLIRNAVPAIRPYQGDEELIRNVMPRPAESIFDKGFLISDLVLLMR